MISVRRLHGLAGAGRARGATAVVDTFRAFSTAAYLLDAGVAELILADTVAEARAAAARCPGRLLCGEEGGAMPDGFDLGNSPGEVVERRGLGGASVVLRTSGGTRCLVAAAASAAPLYAASLVVAAATAAALRTSDEVTVVTAGRAGIAMADEDDVTADHLEALTAGRPSTPDLARIVAGEPGRRLREAAWSHPDDAELCLAVDRFRFTMRAEIGDGVVRLVAHD